jgi:MoaA/NifB/PqqE/SkfB family radical SAM enzyme
MDPKRKFFLLKQSKNFCAAPWTNLYLEANGDILTCCVGQSVLGNIRTNKLTDILNSIIVKEIQTSLVNDIPHQNCTVCQDFSSKDNSWLRSHYNDLAKNLNIDYTHDDFVLNSVDLRWSNSCNFKCVYCGPKCSSSLEKELNITFSNGDQGNQEILDFVLINQDNIKEIYLAGGEPLLMKENRTFLERLSNFDVKLRINTNLSNINEKNSILSLIKKFKDVLWTVSVDNTQNRYEYTRSGGNWQQFIKNVKTIQQLDHNIRFNMVYFIGNALTFDDDFIFLKTLVPNCDFSIVPTINKDVISARNLPDHLKPQAKEKLQKLIKDLAITSSLCNNLTNCINELEKDSNNLDYKQYFEDIDRRRNTNWRQTFPELV